MKPVGQILPDFSRSQVSAEGKAEPWSQSFLDHEAMCREKRHQKIRPEFKPLKMLQNPTATHTIVESQVLLMLCLTLFKNADGCTAPSVQPASEDEFEEVQQPPHNSAFIISGYVSAENLKIKPEGLMY